MPLLETITFEQSTTKVDSTLTYADLVKTQCVEMTVDVRSDVLDTLDSESETVKIRTSWTAGIKNAYDKADFFMFRNYRYKVINRSKRANMSVYWTGERVK